MDLYELDELSAERARSGRAYFEFLRVPAMSAGLYELPAGGVDPQQPHSEDEVYYVVRGRARITVAEEDRPVRPGCVVFVKAGVAHRFHSIVEDLAVLVFFAPAEYTLAP
jgi:mannose-6-phosphate isomerase-like protein (cupin superfamily)